MVTMLKNKCSVWKRIKFPTFRYNCYYFTWSDTYFIQFETLLINHPSYVTSVIDAWIRSTGAMMLTRENGIIRNKICRSVILSTTYTIRTCLGLKTDFRDDSAAWTNIWPGLARLLSCIQNKTVNVRINLILRHALATFVAVEKQKVLHIVSVTL